MHRIDRINRINGKRFLHLKPAQAMIRFGFAEAQDYRTPECEDHILYILILCILCIDVNHPMSGSARR